MQSKLHNLLGNGNVPWGKAVIDVPRRDDAVAAAEAITKPIIVYIRCYVCRLSQTQWSHCIAQAQAGGRCPCRSAKLDLSKMGSDHSAQASTGGKQPAAG